jgi:hypothetical protein
MLMKTLLVILSICLFVSMGIPVRAQDGPAKNTDAKAEAVIAKAIQSLGGDRYLQVKSQIGRGKYSLFRDNAVISFQSFVDVIVFPDKERTEFKGGGSRTIQTNTGSTGWVYDGDQKLVKVQTELQISNFKNGLRSTFDYLLRGAWKNEAELTYVGKRAATLGKRNDVVKLIYADGFVVEYEFADDGMPQKAIYSRGAIDGETLKEEDRYAQFVDVDGIKTPFIIDRFRNGAATSRINYESVEFNKSIPPSVFLKPLSPKEVKDLKL